VAVAVLLSWQWLSSIVLAGLSFVVPLEVVQKAWAVPGWTALTFPVAVAAQMLFIAYREPRVARAERVTA
jgi:tellurite resistance protein TehA-like permease